MLEADVADRAGAPTRKTEPEQMMAASVMFHLAGVDKRAFMEGIKTDPQELRESFLFPVDLASSAVDEVEEVDEEGLWEDGEEEV